MAGGLMQAIRRFVLWDYARASWQYDVMVILILAFVFLTPRAWFRDQPRASSVVMLPSEENARVYWIEPELLWSTPEDGRLAKAAELVGQRTGRKSPVVRLEPIYNSEEEIKGFMAFTRP